jgi:hypothetical protein
MNNTLTPAIPANPFTVGEGATCHGWSDSRAYTVIAVTAKSVTLRRDKATLLNGIKSGAPDALSFSPGGFCGHTSGTQRYEYAQDEAGSVVIARLHKHGRWMTPGNERVTVGRHEHYDFNF